MNEVYILDVLRTPCGKGNSKGALFEVKPINLLANCLDAIKERNSLETKNVDDFALGCMVPYLDQADNLAKTALMYAGWDNQVSGLQLNRFQSSGLEAISYGASKIGAGWAQTVLAGGLESTSRIRRRENRGAISSDPELINKIGSIPAGMAADLIATIEQYSPEALNQYAIGSHQKTLKAQEKGYFNHSVIPILDRNNIPIISKDEMPDPEISLEKLETVEPYFPKSGRSGFETIALKKYPLVEKINYLHHSGNVALPADGAGLMLLGNETSVKNNQLKARAKITTIANFGTDWTIMHLGGIAAAEKALKQADLKASDIDLWYINETFAAPALKFQNHFQLDSDRLNPNGGTIAIGDPLGATGIIICCMLLEELERQSLKRGLVSMSAEGGLGVSLIISRDF